MAGAGVRVFQPGEVLSASTVNTFLMDQAVCRFASAAARDAAFGGEGQPSLSEGRVCYLDSINVLQYYSGASWISISAEAVSGAVEAKGDLIVGVAPTTVGRLPVGANNFYLIADSSTPSGLSWAASTIEDGSIVNSDINDNAAIALGKIADAAIEEKVANYTLVLTDKNKFIKMSVAAANTVTVPTNASVGWPIGSQIHIIQYGAGKTQVIPQNNTVYIYATPGTYLRAQYSSATLLKCETNVWLLTGDLSAS